MASPNLDYEEYKTFADGYDRVVYTKNISQLGPIHSLNPQITPNVSIDIVYSLYTREPTNRCLCYFGAVWGHDNFEALNQLLNHCNYSGHIVYFRDKYHGWYNGLLGAFNNWLNQFINRHNIIDLLFTGVSMGGYAAICLSIMVGFGTCVAFSPQSFNTHNNNNVVTYADGVFESPLHTRPPVLSTARAPLNIYNLNNQNLPPQYNTKIYILIGKSECSSATEMNYENADLAMDGLHAGLIGHMRNTRIIVYPRNIHALIFGVKYSSFERFDTTLMSHDLRYGVDEILHKLTFEPWVFQYEVSKIADHQYIYQKSQLPVVEFIEIPKEIPEAFSLFFMPIITRAYYIAKNMAIPRIVNIHGKLVVNLKHMNVLLYYRLCDAVARWLRNENKMTDLEFGYMQSGGTLPNENQIGHVDGFMQEYILNNAPLELDNELINFIPQFLVPPNFTPGMSIKVALILEYSITYQYS